LAKTAPCPFPWEALISLPFWNPGRSIIETQYPNPLACTRGRMRVPVVSRKGVFLGSTSLELSGQIFKCFSWGSRPTEIHKYKLILTIFFIIWRYNFACICYHQVGVACSCNSLKFGTRFV
jgi:hypothetical protein